MSTNYYEVTPVQQRGLEPTDVAARLDDFRCLKDGWLDGRGIAPPQPGLDWFGSSFDRHYPADLPIPHLYPTAEGGLQAEWSIDGIEVSVDVDLGSRLAYWHRLDLRTETDRERQLNLAHSEAWAWLSAQIRELVDGRHEQ